MTADVENRTAVAEQLRRLGVYGELVLYDEACGVRLLALPSLEPTGEDAGGCEPRGAVSPDGSTIARCTGDRVELLVRETGHVTYTVSGCAPAWRPDGMLTVTLGREVVQLRPCAGRPVCPETLISRSELERAARRHPTSPPQAPLRVHVDGVVWLTNTRAAVLLSIRLSGRFAGIGPMAGIAFFDDGRLRETQPFFRTTGGRLDVSPRGGYVTLTPDVILRADGTQVNLPPHLRGIRDFAWSPDESFLAVATRHAVVVLGVGSLEGYDATRGGLRSVTIPQQAVDLTWR